MFSKNQRSFLALVILVVFASDAIADNHYTFTKIADTSNPDFGNFANAGPAINEGGVVSFLGCSGPISAPVPDCGFFKGDGSTIVRIANAEPLFGQRTLINNAGVVLFESDRSIAIGDGGPIIVIADSNGSFNDENGDPVRSPSPGSINDSGEVSFTATLEGSVQTIGVFKGSGGEITTIESGLSGVNQISAIDSLGNVAYHTSAPFESIRIGDGNTTRTVVDDSGQFFQLGPPSLNELGAVAFKGSLNEPPTGARPFGVYVAETDGSITTIADNSVFRSFAQISLNDLGDVVFKALLNNDFGIFTGSDPSQDKVIVPGENLFDSTVELGQTSLFLHTESLNNAGQIAFQARLDDGTIGIYRADPVPATRIVNIDIKPGSDPNCFNINGHGVIPVAILGENTLDVTTIDVDSLLFGGLQVRQRKGRALCSVEDVNDDTYWDLVCKFDDVLEDWVADEDSATLTGQLYDRTNIEGTDSICLVPKKDRRRR